MFIQHYNLNHVDTNLIAKLKISNAAFVYAFSNIMWMCFFVSIVGFFLSFLLINNSYTQDFTKIST